ncbi:hypothetical protein PQI07_01250 [Methylobacterium sp. 092160098-2]|uniref:hypothetical protein n=1 Tax=Methylobacterium sp. 092160098-2 TaxID=3025129 RepID=UPI002381C138|nr:hypothetical protein [Methylobacterium sp. 092160098-2]MDE4909328.1 hypothetical protein [Methylobacterium sp. 092160098-2]
MERPPGGWLIGGAACQFAPELSPCACLPFLSPDEAAVYDAATALNAGGVLPGPFYARVQAAFGPRGIAELIHLVGLYAMVCTTLNGFNVPIPDQQVDPAP